MLKFARGLLRYYNHGSDSMSKSGLKLANRLARVNGLERFAKNKLSLVFNRNFLRNIIRLIWIYGSTSLLCFCSLVVVITISSVGHTWFSIHYPSTLE